MAKEQSVFNRAALTQGQNIATGSAFESLGNAAIEVSSLISNKVTQLAVEDAAKRGASDATGGVAPDSLAIALTPATKAYNDAVNKTEATHIVTSASKQIQEAYLKYTNPETFKPESPAHFQAELNGIMQGTLENARDSNRAEIQAALEKVEAHASVQMLQHSIKYDNQRVNAQYHDDIQDLIEQRRDAAIKGDSEALNAIDAHIESAIDNYGQMSQAIKTTEPEIRRKLEKVRQVDEVISSYTKAASEGESDKWLSDFAKNTHGLDASVWQESAKDVLTIHNTQKRLSNDLNAQAYAKASFGVQSGLINSADQIQSLDNITVAQQYTLMSSLMHAQASTTKHVAGVFDAQKNIKNGTSALIPSQVKSAMFDDAVNNLEQEKNAPASLADMSKSILGTNDHPASGLPNTPLGTNVSKFDSLVEANLLSQDPIKTAQASMVYQDMVGSQQQPSSIKISGKALSVATLYHTLSQGDTTPQDAANLAINSVLRADEPEFKQRNKTFNQNFTAKKLNSTFKDMFGTKVDAFKTNAALGMMTDTLKAHYLAASSEQSAIDATKYEMRSWGTSEYFPDGLVAQPVPEKELSVTSVGYAFQNQIRVGFQGVIDRNTIARAQDKTSGIPVIEWSDPKQNIDVSKITDEDKVMQPLGFIGLGDDKSVSPGAPSTVVSEEIALFGAGGFGAANRKPRIKVDGHESELVIVPGPDSRLGDGVRYTYGYHDKFNNLQLIPDAQNNPTGLAQFAPKELDQWAPTIMEAKNQDALREEAIKIKKTQLKQTIDNVRKNASVWDKLTPTGGVDPQIILEYMTAESLDNSEIVKLLKARKERKESPSMIRKDMLDADRVSIKPMTKEGN